MFEVLLEKDAEKFNAIARFDFILSLPWTASLVNGYHLNKNEEMI